MFPLKQWRAIAQKGGISGHMFIGQKVLFWPVDYILKFFDTSLESTCIKLVLEIFMVFTFFLDTL